MVSRFVVLAPILVLLGCRAPIDPHLGGGPGSGSPEPDPPPAAPEQEPSGQKPGVSDDVVERAALPFHGLRLKDGEPLPSDQFFDELARTHAVCVGEHHDNPHHHFAQLQVLAALIRRGSMTGRIMGLGLEMFERPFQETLEDYGAGIASETQLLEASEWDDRWGYAFAFYRPMLELARSRGVALLALNAPSELVDAVAASGVGGLDEEQSRWLPELDLDDKGHRSWFDTMMRAHPHTGKDARHRYSAQVVWDESMAETAAGWLAARHPARQLVILAGAGHCMHAAVPKRLARRMRSARVVSVLPVLSDVAGHGKVRDKAKGYDYAFVMTAE